MDLFKHDKIKKFFYKTGEFFIYDSYFAYHGTNCSLNSKINNLNIKFMYFVTDYEKEFDDNLEDNSRFDDNDYFDDSSSAESKQSQMHKLTPTPLPKSSVKSLPPLNQLNQKQSNARRTESKSKAKVKRLHRVKDVSGAIPCVGSSGLMIQQCVIAKIFHLPMSKS